MAIAGEDPPLNDCFTVNLDVEDSPSVEIPLTELYDMVTSSITENYHEIIRDAIVQILEDTMWITPSMMSSFLNAPFSIFDIRADGTVISLRAMSLQRLVAQSISNRPIAPIMDLRIPLLVRFKSPESALPTPLSNPPSPIGTMGGRSTSRSGPPSNVSETELLDQVSELPGASPVLHQPRTTATPRTAEGQVDASVSRGGMSVPGTEGPETVRDYSSIPPQPQRTTTFAPGPYPSVGATFRGIPWM
jgi:hypothetical protein